MTPVPDEDPPPERDPELVAGITVAYRIRFDDCGADGRVRTSSLLRYAQDVAWIHSERLGFDRAWYAARGLAWVARSVELGILVEPALGDTIRIATAITGLRKVWARRRTEARLPDGTLAFWGHTDWVMTDSRGMPGRVPPEFPAAFVVTPGTFEPIRIPLPPTPEGGVRHLVPVRPQDIDPMAHVNNAAYMDYFAETLLAAGADGEAALSATPRRVRIEYLAAATPGARPTGEAFPLADGEGEGWAWRLVDESGGRDLAHGRLFRE